MSYALGKTPWIDKAFAKTWDKIAAAVGEQYLPLTEPDDLDSVQEFGCGHYGCVMPTKVPGIVCKLTSDETEAYFVAAMMKMGQRPEGIVEYKAIYRLSEMKYRRRQLYVLWREEAYDIGFVIELSTHRSYEGDAAKVLLRGLNRFKMLAHNVKTRLGNARDPWAMVTEARRYESWAREHVQVPSLDDPYSWSLPDYGKGAKAVAWELRACEELTELMENEYGSDLVGGALSYYQENGLLLADVHANNVGKVRRPDYQDGAIVITDPGHAVPLDAKWAEVQIATL